MWGRVQACSEILRPGNDSEGRVRVLGLNVQAGKPAPQGRADSEVPPSKACANK